MSDMRSGVGSLRTHLHFLRLVAPLVTRAAGTGSHRAVDPAGLCEALFKRQKNDAASQRPFCEAVTRTPTKTLEPQSALVLQTGNGSWVLQNPRRPRDPRSPRLRNLGKLRRGEHYRQTRRSKGQTLHAE
jgi:hypothetical protein